MDTSLTQGDGMKFDQKGYYGGDTFTTRLTMGAPLCPALSEKLDNSL
jgi:hypothetical protein